MSGITRAESAAKLIRGAILSGRYLSGERLIEIRIAVELELSQNTIRDALRILEQEEWVVKYPRKGVYVRSFSAADAAEVCGLIAAVETLALTWALEHLDKTDRAALQALIAAARKAVYVNEPRQALDHLLHFHERIGAAANRPLIMQFLERLYNQVRLLEALRQARAPRTGCELDALIDEHEKLLRLIEAGDPTAACDCLREQIERYSATMLVALRL